MADLTTLTDDELLDKIIDELELSARQPEYSSNNVYHDRCGNAHLYVMVARLASECGALKSRMNQQYEMIVQLQNRLDSQTNEEQQVSLVFVYAENTLSKKNFAGSTT